MSEHRLAMKEQRAKWAATGLVVGFLFCATVFTLGYYYGAGKL